MKEYIKIQTELLQIYQILNYLSDIELSDNKIFVLKLVLKHGILIRPKETEMVVIMDDWIL